MIRDRVRAGLALVGAAVTSVVALGLPPAAASPGTPAKPAIFHDGTWLQRSSSTSGPATSVFRYGRDDDFPVMGDWNGDGSETVGVARSTPAAPNRLVWYLRNSNSAGNATTTPFPFGTVRFVAVDQLGSIPVVGDWDGDGDDTVGVVYYSDSTTGPIRWELRNSNTPGPPDLVFTYSRGRDVPVVGDWDGDGTDTPGVRRHPNRWLLRNTSTAGAADVSLAYGATQGNIVELPVVGDWDGNGTDTVGVLRNVPASKAEGGFPRWLVRNSNTTGPADVSIVYGSDAFSVGLPVDFVPRLAFH
jgi:hypothetical protein